GAVSQVCVAHGSTIVTRVSAPASAERHIMVDTLRTIHLNGKPVKLGKTLVIAIACMPLVSMRSHAQSPLDHAHAHNDYEHARPLLDALDRGYGSVEADIYLVDGALLVAHARDSVRADRTLESLYLAPLRAWIGARGGYVYAGRPPLTLLIDVKSHAESAWVALEPLLRRYDDVITSWHGDSMTTRPVVAVISGERPLVTLPAQRDRWAGLDGRLADLDSVHGLPAVAMPLVSDDWKQITNWRGRGPPPRSARRRLASAVARAHARGRRLRFWNTPDVPVVWRLLVQSGVDLIGADDLEALRLFLSDSSGGSR
ncbi:MAG: phosphatidylinositol-specific phospholipase C/glycerophosphodiester phosphodiesterase family protein, partial [Gemmatimonadaceae bacterium]